MNKTETENILNLLNGLYWKGNANVPEMVDAWDEVLYKHRYYPLKRAILLNVDSIKGDVSEISKLAHKADVAYNLICIGVSGDMSDEDYVKEIEDHNVMKLCTRFEYLWLKDHKKDEWTKFDDIQHNLSHLIRRLDSENYAELGARANG